ncbi:MAG: TIGR03087 family PEP-CTERM/XrtA system glycosyltransferase [Sphingomonadales bacterium]|nr:TIGR03087 family PEP-CTERM/XrtA system glycosyltransferase [Sphingomonadales bacterium]MDE2169929.1 TIGR03087 family PEP-CTERM/XrtA system glycosyltransferase [Sphingomonadales bacterium]
MDRAGAGVTAPSGEILFLAHRMPFPPDRGDKIHSHHVLRALAKIAPVHVGCFAEDRADWAQEHVLSELAESYCLRARTKPLALAGLEALVKGAPISLTAFHDRKLAAWVKALLATGRIGTIFIFSGQMGQYVPDDFAGRVILDLVDVDSAKFEAYASAGKFPMRWVHAREGHLLRAVETHYARRAQATLLVSQAEADLFSSRLPPEMSAHVGVLPNGIDCDYFAPGIAADRAMQVHSGPHLIFTGQMDYPPNIAAVARVVQRLMPAVLARYPAARFHVVGRAPTALVRGLHGTNGCIVHGAVPDVRPYLAGATLALIPLDIARGIQNKVLEAMAMALPCVLSSGAANGIGARDGVDYAVADDDDDLVAAILTLLADRDAAQAMGQAARHHVLARASWQAALAPLADLVTP